MKTLVFVLLIETLTADGLVEDTAEYGVWKNVNSCIYFARQLTLQSIKGSGENKFGKIYEVPVRAFCKPKYIDPKETIVFEQEIQMDWKDKEDWKALAFTVVFFAVGFSSLLWINQLHWRLIMNLENIKSTLTKHEGLRLD